MSITSLPASVAVLDGAVEWTHGCLQRARTSPLSLPTPCTDWDLGQLLVHMDESMVAIAEAAELGHIPVEPPVLTPVGSEKLVDRLVQRACRIRAAWHRRVTSAPVGVGDLALGRDSVALIGALEIAVHGWDVATSTGQDRPLPADLAAQLHDVALAVVTPLERVRRFADAVPVAPSAGTATRLLAHLGRTVTRPGMTAP